ncbi:MAG: copper resistance protein NlpE N-terminal domain-containing protein [Methyloprofundus sp.]|nr:copper resistance protein NlpE N-terminal domain-containing protein [Methyloprofundus sp.]
MKAFTSHLKQALNLILFSTLSIAFNPALAQTDKQAMEAVQRARELTQKGMDHSQHQAAVDPSKIFRGVYYGYLPCGHCAGIKMTLSLKNKNNYLLVTQYAQESIKEYYEKGKYTWDDESQILTLTSRKDSSISKYSILDEGTLLPYDADGKPRKVNQDEFFLLRADKSKSREVHIH